jgi:capsular polysaccharide biosynthesis protein
MQDQSPATPAYDLGHYLRPLQRQRKWLAIAVIGGLVLGLAYTVLSKPTYTAAARVNVAPPPASLQQASANQTAGRTTATINMDTEAQILKSLPVATLAQQTLKTTSKPNALLKRVTVSVPANTTVLRIACTARSAGKAQDCANAVANAYLSNRAHTEAAAISKQAALVNAQIAKNTTQIANETAQALTFAKGTAKRDILFQSAGRLSDAITQTLDPLQTTYQNELPVSAGNLFPASRGIASQTSRGIPPITGLVLGLIIGLAVAYGRERFDRNVRHRDDLVSAGVELVAEIEIAGGGPASRTRFDQRIASIVAGSFDADGGIIYVADVSPGQAAAEVAANLAGTLASVGHQVELVRPFGVSAVETTSVEPAAPPPLDTEAAMDAAAAALLGWPGDDDEPTAPVANAELVVATPAELVLTPVDTASDSIPMTIRIQLELARHRSHFVVVEGDPAVSDPQAYVLAGLSDATLLVVDPETTKRRDLAEVVDQLSVTGTELLGAVIWRPLRAKGSAGSASKPPTAARTNPLRRKPSQPPVAVRQTGRGGADPTTGSVRRLNGTGSSLPSRPVDAAR